MEPCVESYCDLYIADLSERLGLDETVLASYLTNSILLNPMFGYEKRVVCSGLMTQRQCVCVLSSILQGFSVRPSRRLGYVSPAPQAAPKDLVVIYSCGSTWGDHFRAPPRSFLSAASVT